MDDEYLTRIATQGYFGRAFDRIVAIATQGHYKLFKVPGSVHDDVKHHQAGWWYRHSQAKWWYNNRVIAMGSCGSMITYSLSYTQPLPALCIL